MKAKSQVAFGGKQIELDDGRTITADGARTCVFCPGSIGLYRDKTGEVVAMLHTIPYCEKFDRLEVEEFVHESAVALGLAADDEGSN